MRTPTAAATPVGERRDDAHVNGGGVTGVGSTAALARAGVARVDIRGGGQLATAWRVRRHLRPAAPPTALPRGQRRTSGRSARAWDVDITHACQRRMGGRSARPSDVDAGMNVDGGAVEGNSPSARPGAAEPAALPSRRCGQARPVAAGLLSPRRRVSAAGRCDWPADLEARLEGTAR